MTTLFEIAQNWLNQDPDAETHAELTALLASRGRLLGVFLLVSFIKKEAADCF